MLIIFDLDNTLIDRDAAFLGCLKEIFLHQGCDLQVNDIENIKIQDDSGKNDRETLCDYLACNYPALGLSSDEIWSFFQGLPEHVFSNHNVHTLLYRLSQFHTLCLLSNGSSFMQRRKLAKAGIEHMFHDVFISGELGICKPDTNIFKHVLVKYDVMADACIMIGDDLLRDIEPAKRMGMHSIWINPSALMETCNPEKNEDKRELMKEGPRTYHYTVNHINDVEKAILACSI